jgi:hypothetical protein
MFCSFAPNMKIQTSVFCSLAPDMNIQTCLFCSFCTQHMKFRPVCSTLSHKRMVELDMSKTIDFVLHAIVLRGCWSSSCGIISGEVKMAQNENWWWVMMGWGLWSDEPGGGSLVVWSWLKACKGSSLRPSKTSLQGETDWPQILFCWCELILLLSTDLILKWILLPFWIAVG